MEMARRPGGFKLIVKGNKFIWQAYVVFVFDSSLYPIQHHEQVQFVQFELENAARKENFRINVLRMTFEECAKRWPKSISTY